MKFRVRIVSSILLLAISLASCKAFTSGESSLESNSSILSTSEVDSSSSIEEFSTSESESSSYDSSSLIEEDDSNKAIKSLVYSSIAVDLIGMGYHVFNAKTEVNNKNVLGLAYTDFSSALQNEEDDTVFIDTGFASIGLDNNLCEEDELYLLNPLSVDDNAIDNKSYEYMVSMNENNLPEGHFIIDDKYIKYELDDNNITYDEYPNVVDNYDLSLGRLYNYDSNEYQFVPYDDIPSQSIDYIPAVSEDIDYEKLQSDLENLLNAQIEKGYSIYKVSITYISVDVINAYKGMLSQKNTINGYSYEYLDSLNIDPNKNCLRFQEDGSIEIVDVLEIESNAASISSWITRFLQVSVATIALVTFILIPPAGVLSSVAISGILGMGLDLFDQVVVKQRNFDEINWVNFFAQGVAGMLSAVIPGSTALGQIGQGLLSGTIDMLCSINDGESFETALTEGLTSAAVSLASSLVFDSFYKPAMNKTQYPSAKVKSKIIKEYSKKEIIEENLKDLGKDALGELFKDADRAVKESRDYEYVFADIVSSNDQVFDSFTGEWIIKQKVAECSQELVTSAT